MARKDAFKKIMGFDPVELAAKEAEDQATDAENQAAIAKGEAEAKGAEAEAKKAEAEAKKAAAKNVVPVKKTTKKPAKGADENWD